MSPAHDDEGRFHTETLKLLLQVAWANDELDARERQLLVRLCKAWNVPVATLDALVALVAAGQPLPQPDLALLRTRPAQVLRAAEVLVAADEAVDVHEEELMNELRTLLGVV
jgi:tellurite resistance protein